MRNSNTGNSPYTNCNGTRRTMCVNMSEYPLQMAKNNSSKRNDPNRVDFNAPSSSTQRSLPESSYVASAMSTSEAARATNVVKTSRASAVPFANENGRNVSNSYRDYNNKNNIETKIIKGNNRFHYDPIKGGLSYDVNGVCGWVKCNMVEVNRIIAHIENVKKNFTRILTQEHERFIDEEIKKKLQTKAYNQPVQQSSQAASSSSMNAAKSYQHNKPDAGRNQYNNVASNAYAASSMAAVPSTPPMPPPPPPPVTLSFPRQRQVIRPNYNRNYPPTKYDVRSDGFITENPSAFIWRRRHEPPPPPPQQIIAAPSTTAFDVQPIVQPKNSFDGKSPNYPPPPQSSSSAPPPQNFRALQFAANQGFVSHQKPHSEHGYGGLDTVKAANASHEVMRSDALPSLNSYPFNSLVPGLSLSPGSATTTSDGNSHHYRGTSTDQSAYDSASTTTINSFASDSPPPATGYGQQAQNGMASLMLNAGLNSNLPQALTSLNDDIFSASNHERKPSSNTSSVEENYEFYCDNENRNIADAEVKSTLDNANNAVNEAVRSILKPIQRPTNTFNIEQQAAEFLSKCEFSKNSNVDLNNFVENGLIGLSVWASADCQIPSSQLTSMYTKPPLDSIWASKSTNNDFNSSIDAIVPPTSSSKGDWSRAPGAENRNSANAKIDKSWKQSEGMEKDKYTFYLTTNFGLPNNLMQIWTPPT